MRKCSLCDQEHLARGYCKTHYNRWQRFGDAQRVTPRSLTTEQRFWQKVDKSGECWLWTSATVGGYGVFVTGSLLDGSKRTVKAHRVSWELTNGAIPAGLCVCHHCDVRLCVNPAHLFLGTQSENTADRDAKGRQAKGRRASKSKLTEMDVRAIRIIYSAGAETKSSIARRYGVRHESIAAIVDGRSWRHVS